MTTTSSHSPTVQPKQNSWRLGDIWSSITVRWDLLPLKVHKRWKQRFPGSYNICPWFGWRWRPAPVSQRKHIEKTASRGNTHSPWRSCPAVSGYYLRDLSKFLTHSGNLEWTDKSKRRGHIFWKSPAQLGQEIYKWGRHLIYLEVHLIHIRWVSDSGQKGAVVTLVELEEEGESNSWRGVSQEVVMQDHGVYLMCITFRWL